MYVGLQLERDRPHKRIFLHQKVYIERMLSKFKLNEARTISVLADPCVFLQKGELDENSQFNFPYQEAVDSLMFLATATRPDIVFAVNAVSRHMNCYNASH